MNGFIYVTCNNAAKLSHAWLLITETTGDSSNNYTLLKFN